MTIKEFAESRGIAQNTVSMYLKRYSDKHAGFVRYVTDENNRPVCDNQGQQMLTDECIAVLERKYPLPEPVAVYEHHPEDLARIVSLERSVSLLSESNARLTEQNSRLLEQLAVSSKELEDSREKVRAIEEKQYSAEKEFMTSAEGMKEEIEASKKAEAESARRVEELEKALEDAKRPWWRRLFG